MQLTAMTLNDINHKSAILILQYINSNILIQKTTLIEYPAKLKSVLFSLDKAFDNFLPYNVSLSFYYNKINDHYLNLEIEEKGYLWMGTHYFPLIYLSSSKVLTQLGQFATKILINKPFNKASGNNISGIKGIYS